MSLGGNTFVLEEDEITESVASFSDGEEKINFSDESEDDGNQEFSRKFLISRPPSTC